MKRRVAVRAVIVKDGKLLAVRLKNYVGKATLTNDYWCTPGGGADEGEPLLAALKREVIEELGPEPDIGALLYIQQFDHNDTEQLEFFFHVRNTDDYVNLDLSRTTHGALEIDTVSFIDASTENVRPTFLTTQNLEEDIIAGSPTKIFSYTD